MGKEISTQGSAESQEDKTKEKHADTHSNQIDKN